MMSSQGKSMLTIISMSLLVFFVSGCMTVNEDTSHKVAGWSVCQFPLLGEKYKITLLLQKTHPFLAEYNEKLNIQDDTQIIKTLSLHPDTGGEEFLNFYLSKSNPSVLRILGKWNEVSVDLNSHKEHMSSNINSDWAYLGRCDKRLYPVRFISSSEAKEEQIPNPTILP